MAERTRKARALKTAGKALIALPVALYCTLGLIFDTRDFLTAMAVLAVIASVMGLGYWLWVKGDEEDSRG